MFSITILGLKSCPSSFPLSHLCSIMNPFNLNDPGPEPEAWVKAREQLAKLSPNNFAKPPIPFGYGGYANQNYE